MSRRAFRKTLTVLVGCFALPVAAHASIRGGTWKTLQTSPLAGFQHHSGEALWQYLTARPEPVEGSLQLTREVDNRFDDRAVRVDWQNHKLGYIPRRDNAAVSQLLDCGETLAWVNASDFTIWRSRFATTGLWGNAGGSDCGAGEQQQSVGQG